LLSLCCLSSLAGCQRAPAEAAGVPAPGSPGPVDAQQQQLHALLDKVKIKGGIKAARSVTKALSDRHFDLGRHGAKWPSRAFSRAVREAAMRHEAAGPSLHGAASAHVVGRRSVVLMAMANDVAMQSTVPIFVQSLEATAVSSAPASNLARHLVLVCSSDSAADMCRALGLGDRWDMCRALGLGDRWDLDLLFYGGFGFMLSIWAEGSRG
jgi:hypothetical protein